MSESLPGYVQDIDRIIADVVNKHAVRVDRESAFPSEAIEAIGKAGLLGLISKKDVGGKGESLEAAAQVVERLGRACGSTAMVVCMHYSATAVIEAHGDMATRKAIASGKHLTTLAFSEQGSRSHFRAAIGTATAKGDKVRLSAKKSWITSATKADSYVWSSKPLAAPGMSSLWLVPRTTSGLRAPDAFDGLGLRGNDSRPVIAEDAEVAKTALLGADGKGFDIMMGVVLPTFSVLSTACSVGLMEGTVARAAEHVRTSKHEHANSTLADLPTVRAYVARIRTATDLARCLCTDTQQALATGRADASLRVLECKAAAGELASEVGDLGMRICGGAAFRKDVAVERYFRDLRALSIMGPTTDVLYDFIGKAALGLPLF